MNSLSEKISAIDLPTILKVEGLELRPSDSGYRFRCCFHDDHNPSASLFNKVGKWHWHCFGCGESGDVVDFIMKRHGLDFNAACRYLSIESGPITPAQKAKIQKNRARCKADEAFKKWVWAAIGELRDTISTAYRISSKWQTIEDFENGCMILDSIADLQGQLDVLTMGSEKDRIGIYNRWKQRGGFF